MPKTYRKKPVEIQAGLLKPENVDRVAAWCGGAPVYEDPRSSVPTGVRIETLEGKMTAQIGDYVIRGVKGEFYPCKPDIFAATYDLVADKDETDAS